MATRSDPPLPLARLRSRGQLTELRAADLRFTPSEARVPQPGDGARAHRRRSGGAGGPDLRVGSPAYNSPHSRCAESQTKKRSPTSSRRSPAATGSSSTTWPTRFWPGNPRRFATFCSAPPSSTDFTDRCATPSPAAPTAPDVGGPRAGKPLRRPARHRALLVPLPPPVRRRTSRRLLAEHPADLPNLHMRASDWFAARGLVVDAVRHALAAEDFDRAAYLIEGGAADTPHRQDAC